MLPDSIPVSLWDEKDIERMRSFLAKKWHQSKSQVTDTEAKFYLQREKDEGPIDAP